MLNKYLDEYYTDGITARRIAQLEGISEHKIGYMFRKQGIPTVNQLINSLKFEDRDLKRILRVKYTNIANRCRGKGNYKNSTYDGLSYFFLPDYIQFCNNNKGIVEGIWRKYVDSGKDLKLALSLDRISSSEDYEVNNVQFVTVGYNAYKSNINPKVVDFLESGRKTLAIILEK